MRGSTVLLVVVAFAVLSFLGWKTRTVNLVEHETFTTGLVRIAHLDDRVSQSVLKARQNLISSFDPLVAEWTELSRARASISQLPSLIERADRDAIVPLIKELDELFAQKLRLTDRFKSEQAILRNSLSYFPVVATELRDAARSIDDSAVATAIDELLVSVLRYHAELSGDASRRVDEATTACTTAHDGLPEPLQESFDIVLSHAKTILAYRERADATTRSLILIPSVAKTEQIRARYEAAFGRAQGQLSIYRNLLLGLAVALVIWGLWSLAKVRIQATQLRRANETLEERVDERTTELRATLAELDQEIEVRKQAEEELREARDVAQQHTQAKSQFLANMSHELRTPLNAIIGYSELLKEDAEDQELEEFVPDLEKIRTAGKHLLELINGVLDLSKIEAGKMELYIEQFEAVELLNGVATIVQPLVEKNRNTLVIEGADSLGTMSSDQTKTRQILFNLLSNACKFTEQGEIRVVCARNPGEQMGEGADDGDVCTIKVTDSGIGMGEQQVAKVFSAFTQADASTTRKFGGTGLGLTITREFCLMMGGTIEVTSVEGEGTTFVVTLPAHVKQTPDAPITSTDASDVDASGRLVLVVDDDPDARTVVSRHLTKSGFRVIQAAGGEEALKLAREHEPAAITLDVILPGMDGWEVLTALKEDAETSKIPIVMLSIMHEPSLAFSLGASAYLSKPVNKSQLMSVVADVLGSKLTPTILVVDDEPSVRETARRFLERNGCAVAEAANGKIGLEHALATPPDLILLDLMMPEMDGFDFLERFRSEDRGRTVPVVVMTAKELTTEDRSRLNGRVEAILQRSGDVTAEDLLDDAMNRIRAAIDS